MNRLDTLEERRKDLTEKATERLIKLERFYKMGQLITLNEETKDFFKLAYDIYGKDIVEGIRNATDKTPAEKDALIGKFDLLHSLIIPFINNK